MASLYLDPKNDLIFKKIFYEHSDLLISFLNALIPLAEGRKIETIEYVPMELVPETPLKKDSTVDVLCKDNYGRLFIVEMQMLWHTGFDDRIVFNASKAYARQAERGEHYELLQPVYSLGILNDVYDNKTQEFYHHYKIVNIENTEEVLKGLEFVMVELPKFNPSAIADRKMAVLWLRFLKEIKDNSPVVSADLLENAVISKAINVCEVAAYTEAELNTYEAYWDYISRERTRRSGSLAEGERIGLAKGIEIGIEKGIKKGMEKGIKKGITKGIEENSIQVVLESKKAGLSIDVIAAITKLPLAKVAQIIEQHPL
jgi:predicted transposase/invertase (TIGR01784 family)